MGVNQNYEGVSQCRGRCNIIGVNTCGGRCIFLGGKSLGIIGVHHQKRLKYTIYRQSKARQVLNFFFMIFHHTESRQTDQIKQIYVFRRYLFLHDISRYKTCDMPCL